MKLIPQSHIIEFITPNALELIERAGRTCYKSEGKIAPGTAERFVRMILGRHHESVIEHASITVRFVTNRGVTHEDVRHRLSSFSQESTRYCNYGGKDVEFILPVWANPNIIHAPVFGVEASCATPAEVVFLRACENAENEYQSLLELGWTPQQAREVLPNALKTELVHTANFRQWRHILKERTSKAAHPQMRALMIPLLKELQQLVPVVFEDIVVTE